MPDIKAIQAELRASKIDGWLFYDHHHRDPIAARVLGLGENGMATRRWFYFIPARGEPRKLVHRIEQSMLDSLAGRKQAYAGWEELHKALRETAVGKRKIAMQYSPENNIPYIGLVDAGTVELVRKLKKKVVSSADLVQKFEATLDGGAIRIASGGRANHRPHHARGVRARGGIRARRQAHHRIRTAAVDARALSRERAHDRRAADRRGAAEQRQSALRAEAARDRARFARATCCCSMFGESCDRPGSVYYDITWVGYLGERVPETYAKIFGIVREARDRAIDFVKNAVAHGRADSRLGSGSRRAGSDSQGRLRQNISCTAPDTASARKFTETARIWTVSKRATTARSCRSTCFSIEPGIYLPEFGIRSEVNVYVSDNEARVTGAIQEEILPLLGGTRADSDSRRRGGKRRGILRRFAPQNDDAGLVSSYRLGERTSDSMATRRKAKRILVASLLRMTTPAWFLYWLS